MTRLAVRYYIASALENADQVKQLKKLLDDDGRYEHTYDWTVHGSVQREGHQRIAEVAVAETLGVTRADVVIVLLRGGRGTHAELGIGIASGKRIILYSPDPVNDFGDGGKTCAFYHHPLVERCGSWVDLLVKLGLL